MTLACSCRNLTKTYGDEETQVIALRGIDLDVYLGELVMLVGPSGCGKTTLLSILSGVLTPDGGTCTILGTEIHNLSDAEKTLFRKKNIGFVFQAFNLIPSLTAEENVTIPLVINNIELPEAERQAHALLEKVGLGHRLHAVPSHLSGGEQQRVAIARSCIHNPRLIVCDEPTSNLDHETGQKVLELFKTTALKENCAILMVTHDMRILPFATRVLKMEDGKIV